MHLLFLCLFVLTSCATHWQAQQEPALVSIHLIDRDGLSESVSNPERIKGYAVTDFLEPQPYQKVLRIFSRDQEGAVHAYVTTYHPNGQVKQYLEIVNNRAFGAYREWHANGTLKVDTLVIEGSADISMAAEKSWIFDGFCHAWNEAGNILADISYSRGSLEGVSRYYHPCGTIWKEIPYVKNLISGDMRIYLESGELLQVTPYLKGVKEGKAYRYWPNNLSFGFSSIEIQRDSGSDCDFFAEIHSLRSIDEAKKLARWPEDPVFQREKPKTQVNNQLAAEETYVQGRLMAASYLNLQGEQVACIENGHGYRALFGKENLNELHEYRHGIPEGEVKVFDSRGAVVKRHYVKNGMKHGEELLYFTSIPGREQQPKLLMNWYEGKIQGIVKTWYDNGTMESQREMSENKSNGVATAWYRSGQLMLIEEYEQGKLKKGDYFKKGEKQPISQVFQGEGTVSYFDPEGNYLRKVAYHHGKPEV